MSKKFFTEIYGCQMNVSDSLELESALTEIGWEKSKDIWESDAVIINTCAVRQTAEDRALKRLGYYKHVKSKKKLAIVFMGCVAQKEKENIIKNYPFVDYVIGPKNRHLIPSILEEHYGSKSKDLEQRIFASFTEEAKEYLTPVPNEKFPYRAFVTIINGCSKFCTYCIVPYTRGFETSIPSNIIIKQVKELAWKGIKEIYLLGQNVNSYGIDSKDITFAQLLKEVSKTKGIERIKFISSHPRDISNELIEEIAINPKISRNIHFAMQSGSNEILRRMNRQHTYEHFLSIIKKLREKVAGIYISTDIIVGFPGETKNEFQDTLNALQEIQFSNSFIYMYSQRSGTAAAKFNDDIKLEEKKRRAQALMEIQEKHTKEHLVKLIGKTLNVLVEGQGNRENQIFGFSEYDTRTVFVDSKGVNAYLGKIVQVEIEELIGRTLVGRLIV